jgi:hypothetical protein
VIKAHTHTAAMEPASVRTSPKPGKNQQRMAHHICTTRVALANVPHLLTAVQQGRLFIGLVPGNTSKTRAVLFASHGCGTLVWCCVPPPRAIHISYCKPYQALPGNRLVGQSPSNAHTPLTDHKLSLLPHSTVAGLIRSLADKSAQCTRQKCGRSVAKCPTPEECRPTVYLDQVPAVACTVQP